MLKFFRQIRKSLLSSGKIGQYVKYAIGEIVLVVLGILIALGINNWNDDRKIRNSEKIFISGVKSDLTQDTQNMQALIEIYRPRVTTFYQLNEHFDSLFQGDRTALDSMIGICFAGQRTFYPLYGFFQSAMSTGEVNSYENRAFLQRVKILYNSIYPRLSDNAQILDDRFSHLSQKYSHERRIKSVAHLNKASLTEVIDDLNHHVIQMDWYMGMLEDCIREVDEILNME